MLLSRLTLDGGSACATIMVGVCWWMFYLHGGKRVVRLLLPRLEVWAGKVGRHNTTVWHNFDSKAKGLRRLEQHMAFVRSEGGKAISAAWPRTYSPMAELC